MIDLGFEGKVRPVMIVSRHDPNAPRALVIAVPVTTKYRGSKYEVAMPRVPWLRERSYANVQGLESWETVELQRKIGKFETSAIAPVKEAIRWALDL